LIGLLLSGAFYLYLALLYHKMAALQGLCAAAAAASVYLLLAGLFNRMAITMHQGLLATSRGPLPCIWAPVFRLQRSRKLPQSDIYRVWAAEEIGRQSRNGRQFTYTVAVMTIDAGRQDLVTRLRQEEAQFLEREIRGSLGWRIEASSLERRVSCVECFQRL